MGGQRFHLVHGYPGEGHETRIWGRVEPDNRSPFPDTICIVGHTPTVFLTDGHDEDFSIWHGDGILDIDCGCGSMKAAHRRLACLRLAACREDPAGSTLYVTLEPCPMCAGGILSARIPELYYGAKDAGFGACGSILNLFEEDFRHHPKIVGHILEEECAQLLQDFFAQVRKKSPENLKIL